MSSNDFKLTNAGLFRGNVEASDYNNFRAVDLETPGTPASDSLVINTAAFTGGEEIQGINFTGKSGAAADYLLSDQQRPDAQRINKPITLPALTAGFDTSELRWAIHQQIEREETDPIVKVTYDDVGDTLTIEHTGSGTLNKLIIDGAPVGTNTRTPL